VIEVAVQSPSASAGPVTRRARLYVLAALLGAASFYTGTQIFSRAPTPGIHALTGRQIAGLATNTAWMDRDARAAEEAPDQALVLLGINPGMTVADVGAGSGYMTTRLARVVGPSGRVYATDLQPTMLRIVEAKATAEKLSNVTVVRGTERETNLPTAAIDLALLVDVYHELSQPHDMLQSIRRSLKPDGRLVLIEYRREDPNLPILPTHRMSVADARAEVEAEGFALEQLISALPLQHILVFHQ
jgi:predicted methyltransferase